MLEPLMILSYLFGHPMGAASHHVPLKLESPAFQNHHKIPQQYLCSNNQRIIPLSWTGVPANTQSLAIIIKDQDAPRNHAYYFAAFNISPNTTGLSYQHLKTNQLKVSSNSWHKADYHPLCPTKTRHHYKITLYALDQQLPEAAKQNAIKLRHLMQGRTLARATLNGFAQPNQKH